MIFIKSFTQRFSSIFFNRYLAFIPIFAILILSMTSCAGGSRGTGILTMRVTGRVLNTNGEGIENLPLTVRTGSGVFETTTNSNGDFDTEILWRFGGAVNFELGASNAVSDFSVDQIPEDTIVMETVWEEGETGSIEPTSINFTSELP